MNKNLFRKLAIQNIKANKTTFLPFMICAITMIAMFYMLYAIEYQVSGKNFTGVETMDLILRFGLIVCGIFSFFVILYTNSYVMKRRAKELGLYSMLGMNKKHIGKVVFWELAITGMTSILAGLTVGILFSKFMFMLMEAMLQLNTEIKFAITAKPIMITAILFQIIFVLGMLANYIRVLRLKPIELMRITRTGEREPKAKWLIAVLGIVCLGIGYYMAVSIENPVKAIFSFFVASLFVIVGTYFSFVSVSIVVLKLLKKNKSFFYNKKHFITVSGLIYRMKQNAVGLANICVLSTAVLVVIFSTVALYIGTEDAIAKRYPKDVEICCYWNEEDTDIEASQYDHTLIEPVLKKRADKYNVKVKAVEYGFSYSCIGAVNGNKFDASSFYSSKIYMTNFMTLDQYNKMSGENKTLGEDEILFWSNVNEEAFDKELIYNGKTYMIVGDVSSELIDADYQNLVAGYLNVVVKDVGVLREINKSDNERLDQSSSINYCYQFDLEGKEADKIAFCKGLRADISETSIPRLGPVDCIYTSRQDFINSYGSLFFIGIFIGTMFLVTTVMIIYYKQISEGYDDREKFIIMRKVGMSDNEIKATIRSQILLVFFLPIIIAVIHILFAFPVIKKLLFLFGLTNVGLIIGCMLATVIIFVIVYAVVYKITAKTYYNCVTSAV